MRLRLAVYLVATLAAPALADLPTRTTPRIDSVVPSAKQPNESAKSTIWFDDFSSVKTYTETSGEIDEETGLGGAPGAMLCLYEKEKQGEGNRKVFFGDSPYGKVVRKGEKFTEIYWRIYVKHQTGFTAGTATPDRGGPDKMSRATSMASDKWNQAMIAHVWSTGDTLTLDPATGVKEGAVVTTRYNDFANLKWLGNKPTAKFPIHSNTESNWWVCVESRAKLNTPGKKDGENQLWIDGRLEAERKNLDFRGTWDGKGINAVFLEAYWNKNSPITQKRWYDNFVISTDPIGPITAPRNPTLLIAPLENKVETKPTEWQVELAEDAEGKSIIYQGSTKEPRITIDNKSGKFEGALAGKSELAVGTTYFCRVKQTATEWSPWHQPFVTEK